jgi:glutathione S-transferase
MNNSDPRFTLHHSAASPFARKVRAVAIELGLEERLHYTQVSVAQGTENAAYAKDVNPLERIPAMTLEDGTTLVDSALICQYLNETTGGTLVPESGKHRWDVLNALSITDGMTEMAVQLRYETFARPEPHRWEAYVADLNRRIVNSLDWLDAHASVLLADSVNLAGIATVCALEYLDFRHPAIGWREGREHLVTAHESLAARKSLASTGPDT